MTENNSKAELTEIPASVILDKIQKGEPVKYDRIRIVGNLNLRKLDLPTEPVLRTEYQKTILDLLDEQKIVSSSIQIFDSEIKGDVDFSDCLFKKDACFNNVTFRGFVWFRGATFRGKTWFFYATFRGFVRSNGATFCGYTGFNGATFRGNAWFVGATFCSQVEFDGAKFEGDVLTFKDATFLKPKSQEEACRRAKNVLAKAGDRDEEEDHFYREMEAKRIQKGILGNSELGLRNCLETKDCLETNPWSFWKFFFYDVLEFIFVQKIFGYGVHPFRLFGWWLAFVVMFAIIYSIKGGLEEHEVKHWYDYFWFSVATAATPGYALYKPDGIFKFVAGVQAILGTFMWAAFITTFAKKYMR